MNDAYTAAEVESGPEVGRGARHIRFIVYCQAGLIKWPVKGRTDSLAWRICLYNGDHSVLTVDESPDKEEAERYLEVWEEALGWPVIRFSEHDTAATKTYLKEETQDE